MLFQTKLLSRLSHEVCRVFFPLPSCCVSSLLWLVIRKYRLACFIFTTSLWEPRLAQTTHGGTRVDRVMLWCLKCFFFFFDIIYTLQKWLKLCWWSPIKYTSVPSGSISWLSEKVRVLLKGLYFYFVAMVTFLASTSAHAHQWLGFLDDSLDVLGSYFTPVPMGR